MQDLLAEKNSFSLPFWEALTWIVSFGFCYMAGGPVFAAGIIGALATRELIRRVYASKLGLPCKVPYLIPLPYYFGTLGAIQSIDAADTVDKNKLQDLTTASILALFVLGILLFTVGLTQSDFSDSWSEGFMFVHHPSLIIKMIQATLGKGIGQPHYAPLALSGIAVLNIAFFSLLPFGQTEGGYLSQALLGTKSIYWTIFAAAVVFALGAWVHPVWFVVLVVFLLTMSHSPEISPGLSPKVHWMRLLLVVILAALCFSSIPLDYKLAVHP